jgi:hypothetical protein
MHATNSTHLMLMHYTNNTYLKKIKIQVKSVSMKVQPV